MSLESLQTMYANLKTKRGLRRRIGKKFQQVQEGDWQGLVNVAREEGYDFTVEELKANLPQGFFKGKGKKPESGWNASTLNS